MPRPRASLPGPAPSLFGPLPLFIRLVLVFAGFWSWSRASLSQGLGRISWSSYGPGLGPGHLGLRLDLVFITPGLGPDHRVIRLDVASVPTRLPCRATCGGERGSCPCRPAWLPSPLGSHVSGSVAAVQEYQDIQMKYKAKYRCALLCRRKERRAQTPVSFPRRRVQRAEGVRARA